MITDTVPSVRISEYESIVMNSDFEMALIVLAENISRIYTDVWTFRNSPLMRLNV